MYRGFSVSTLGESHKESGSVCQDSSRYLIADDFAIVAVSDGHGGANYFRSDIGSSLAVEAALLKFEELFRHHRHCFECPRDREKNLRQLEGSILFHWRNAIRLHFEQNPLNERELEICRENSINPDKIESHYGTTLIAAAMTNEFALALQIGDGACVFITEDQPEIPVPSDDRLHFGLTTSLCDSEAIDNFRHVFRDKTPEAVFLSTDGFVDSYGHDFFKMALEICHQMSSNYEKTQTALKDWLPVVSARGSRDDLTVAGIYYNKFNRHDSN
jgi:serine/threonine protein phosphatase PrpC